MTKWIWAATLALAVTGASAKDDKPVKKSPQGGVGRRTGLLRPAGMPARAGGMPYRIQGLYGHVRNQQCGNLQLVEA